MVHVSQPHNNSDVVFMYVFPRDIVFFRNICINTLHKGDDDDDDDNNNNNNIGLL
jgi:hypothetical protein